MRDTTILRRLLALPEIRVVGAELGPAGLIVDVRLGRTRLRCPACPFTTRRLYDRRPERRWRHLDLGGWRCFLRMPRRRLRCPRHGVRTEAVPFAAAHAGHTLAFEELVAWQAQRLDKTSITRLVRVSWRSVGRILERWMARAERPDLSGLRRIGVDEKSWRKGHRYITLVYDHDRRRVVWMADGLSDRVLGRFFAALTPERKDALRVVSMDMSRHYLRAVQAATPLAEVCFDPFHVVTLANFALDQVRREEWNRARRAGADPRAVKHTRWALLKHPARLSATQRGLLEAVRRGNARLWRAYELKEMVRAIYAGAGVADAGAWLDGFIRRARRSRLRHFAKIAGLFADHRAGILAAVRHGISNGRLEGLNNRLALLSHRSAGFHSAQAFMALAMLCVGGYTPALPFH